MKLLGRNILYIEAVLAILVAIYAALRWPELPLVNRMVCLFFVALVMHVWEESRYPGGFSEMVAEKLHFVSKDLHFGELITGSLVIVVGLVPILLQHVIWLSMAVMILGLLESVVHVAIIKLFHLHRPYSPGMMTAVLLMLPISLYTVRYTVQHNLMPPLYWLLSFGYLLLGLMVAQRIVVRASGMRYIDFLKNVRASMFGSNPN
jgi:hypothetical protein